VRLLQTLCKSTRSHCFSPYSKGDTAIKNRLLHVYVMCINPMTLRLVCGSIAKCNWWLSRRSAAACLLRSWVRIPPGTWMFVCFVCVVSRGLCDELITRPEESYRLWCVVVCDLETSWMRRPWPVLGSATSGKSWWLSAGSKIDPTDITLS
jgi:hypothetical protein